MFGYRSAAQRGRYGAAGARGGRLGATYVQTPEMDRDAAARPAPPPRRILRRGQRHHRRHRPRTAGELGIHVHVGSTAIALDDGKLANRGYLFGPDGKILNRYDKIHMFDVDLDNGESWRESAAYRPGQALCRRRSPRWVSRSATTFLALFRAQVVAGAEVMTALRRLHLPDRRGALGDPSRARAIENGMFS